MKSLAVWVLQDLGVALLRQEKYAQAKAVFLETITLLPDEYFVHISINLAYIGGVYMGVGEMGRAARLLGFAETRLKDHFDLLSHLVRIEYECIKTQVQEQLSGPGLAKAWQEGAAMTMAEALLVAEVPVFDPGT